MRGFVNILKPLKMTSSDVVVKVRGILRRATGEKQKVGHLGTLDPCAVGVLPVAVGKATRLFDLMQDKQKTYIATFKFGVSTDTLDREGKITATDDSVVSARDIECILPELIGEIEQLPPQYSAKTVGGRRAYDIARAGGEAKLQPKTVHIYDIKLLASAGEKLDLPCGVLNSLDDNIYELSENEYAFEITCGSGTYIRAIARDMAELLGTVGYMSSLCRTKTGGFDIANAITLDEFEKNPLDHILPIDIALDKCERVDLNESEGTKALNGIKIRFEKQSDLPMAVYVSGELVGLGEVTNGLLSIKTRL